MSVLLLHLCHCEREIVDDAAPPRHGTLHSDILYLVTFLLPLEKL